MATDLNVSNNCGRTVSQNCGQVCMDLIFILSAPTYIVLIHPLDKFCMVSKTGGNLHIKIIIEIILWGAGLFLLYISSLILFFSI